MALPALRRGRGGGGRGLLHELLHLQRGGDRAGQPSASPTPTSRALAVIAAEFPEHQVVPVPGLVIAYGGGRPALHHPTGTGPPMTARLIVSTEIPESLARTRPAQRGPLRLGLVQERWRADPEEQPRGAGHRHPHGRLRGRPDRLPAGADALPVPSRPRPTVPRRPVRRPRTSRAVPRSRSPPSRRSPTASTSTPRCIERADEADGLGFNTAVVIAPDGRLLSRTRKLHIPITAGYYEDKYFRPRGPPRIPRVITCGPAAARSRLCRSRSAQIPPATGLSSAPRPAGTSGSRSSLAPTRSREPRCSSIRRRSAPSPIIRALTPSPSGSR